MKPVSTMCRPADRHIARSEVSKRVDVLLMTVDVSLEKVYMTRSDQYSSGNLRNGEPWLSCEEGCVKGGVGSAVGTTEEVCWFDITL